MNANSPAANIRYFETPSRLFDEAAQFILSLVKAKPSPEKFSFALSGGSTPRGLYERMTQEDLCSLFPWERIHFFWGDERWVPASDKRSNYRMVRETLLDPAQVPQANIHPIPTSVASPELAAADYEKILKDFFQQKFSFPAFDLILLGLGEDGHTASLFADDPAIQEGKRWVTTALLNTAEPRVTLTLPVMNHGRSILFLVSGEKKKEIFRKILDPKYPTQAFPAQKVHPVSGRVLWFISI